MCTSLFRCYAKMCFALRVANGLVLRLDESTKVRKSFFTYCIPFLISLWLQREFPDVSFDNETRVSPTDMHVPPFCSGGVCSASTYNQPYEEALLRAVLETSTSSTYIISLRRLVFRQSLHTPTLCSVLKC